MIVQHAVKNRIDLGFTSIHLYGIIFTVSFLLVYLLTQKNIEKKNIKLPADDSIGLMGLLFACSIIGARLFYVFVYWGKEYLKNPSDILKIWEGGLSYHGGLLGTIIGLFIYAAINKTSFKKLADAVVPAVPVALFLGRIGHYLNGEMWGRVTDGTWGVVFIQSAENPVPRHPVQLYEAFMEGIVLFLIMFLLNKKKLAEGQLSGLFLIISGVFRFITEFFREPDEQLGFIMQSFTMGQILSVPVIILGVILFLTSSSKKA